MGGEVADSGSTSNVTVTTTSLDVKTPEQRALVEEWLRSQQSDGGGFVSRETLYPDRFVAGDPFQNLMYTNSTTSNVGYDKVTDKSSFAAEVGVGVAFGIDLSAEITDSRAREATYLGTSGSDGTRPPVEFSECEAD